MWLERWLLHSGLRGLLWQSVASQYISPSLNLTYLSFNVTHAAGEGLPGVAPPPFGGLCETNIFMRSQTMSWLSLSDFWRWKHCKRGQEGQEKQEVWKMWEKWGGGKQKVKQPRPWQGRGPLCWRQRRGKAPQLPGRDESFCMYQVDYFLQNGIILQIEGQQRNGTRKSKHKVWGMSFICCDLGLNPTIIVVGFVLVVIIKKRERSNSGDFNYLLSRIKRRPEKKKNLHNS